MGITTISTEGAVPADITPRVPIKDDSSERSMKTKEREMQKMKDKIVFDKSDALKMIEDDEEFLRELAEIFINDVPEQMSEIKEAVISRNNEALEKSAHKLKGAVANFGRNATTDTAFKLERMAKDSKLDGVEEVYSSLVKDIENLMKALNAL